MFMEKADSGFLVGKSLTWVDLRIAEHVLTTRDFVLDFFDPYPEVPAYHCPQ